MKINQAMRLAAVALLLSIVQVSAEAAQSESGQVVSSGARPDIVFILTDDMRYSDLGCYGSEIQTPNLDVLAGDGVRFSQFFNTSLCSSLKESLFSQHHG